MLYVSALGPLMAGKLLQAFSQLGGSTQAAGFAGVWALCAVVYAIAALLFTLAPPSPQVKQSPAPCSRWVATSTPALLARLLCERNGGLHQLCIALLLGEPLALTLLG